MTGSCGIIKKPLFKNFITIILNEKSENDKSATFAFRITAYLFLEPFSHFAESLSSSTVMTIVSPSST